MEVSRCGLPTKNFYQDVGLGWDYGCDVDLPRGNYSVYWQEKCRNHETPFLEKATYDIQYLTMSFPQKVSLFSNACASMCIKTFFINNLECKNKIQIQKRKYRIWVKKLRNRTFKLSPIRCVLADLVRVPLHNYICMSWKPLLPAWIFRIRPMRRMLRL